MEDNNKLTELCSRNYKDQAVWFLNSYWEEFAQREAEKIWNLKHKMDQLDLNKHEQGCALDELQAHRFLEQLGETLTVTELRDKLKAVGVIIGEKIKYVPLIWYLIYKYSIDWRVLIKRPQGSKDEIEKAAAMLTEVQRAFTEAEDRAKTAAEAVAVSSKAESQAKSREAEAKSREDEARARETEAKAREHEAKQAQEELESALRELNAQESAYKKKTEELKKASEEGGAVSRNKAANELAQHLAADPLPLRKAKITQEAAVKKAEKATNIAAEAAKAASGARAVAEAAAGEASRARKDAEAAKAASEAAARAAEAALDEAAKRMTAAEAYLQEAKKRLPFGATWWMERELHEKRKFLPKAKGGIDKK